jgi:hypothetical protein
MPTDLIIQKHASRVDSVRAKLAAVAWKEGLSAFITNGVPFSFSSGHVLADGIAYLVDALAQDSDDITVMELGAGIGYLSSFCLDTLSQRFPDSYRKSRFVVTDGAPALVQDAESRGVLSQHAPKSRFAVADLRDHHTILAEKPRMLILSYLIDAICPEHTLQQEHSLFEARIQSVIRDDLAVYDGAVWPPRILDAQAIVGLLTDQDSLTPELGRRIVPHIEESWSWTVDDDADGQGPMVNSRRDVVRNLCEVLSSMPEESVVVVTDFGYVEPEEITPSEMMTEYGLCAFWAVFFGEIQEIAKGFGFETFIQAGEEGETHTLVIYKGEKADGLFDAFVTGFEDMVSDRPRYVLYNLEEDAGLSEIHKALDTIEETMPEADVNSYGNLSRFAHLLLQFGDVERAVVYAQRCVERYPEVAAPEMTILGSAEGRKGNLAYAETCFLRAIDVADGYAEAHLGLSGVYKARKDWEQYFSCIKAYLRTADCDVVEVVSGIAETLKGTELNEEAERADAWLVSLTEV